MLWLRLDTVRMLRACMLRTAFFNLCPPLTVWPIKTNIYINTYVWRNVSAYGTVYFVLCTYKKTLQNYKYNHFTDNKFKQPKFPVCCPLLYLRIDISSVLKNSYVGLNYYIRWSITYYHIWIFKSYNSRSWKDYQNRDLVITTEAYFSVAIISG